MLGKLIPNQIVTIYGAGFAGLSLAYRLKQLNVPFILYEKNYVGGKISTSLTPRGPLEAAASTLYINAHAEKFIKDLQLPYLASRKKLKRWIWQEKKAVSPFSMKLIGRLLAKSPTKFPKVRQDSTLEEIFLPLLGRKYTDELLSCVLQGIYAAEARDLHFLSIFPFAEGKTFPSYFSFFCRLKEEMKKDSSINIKGSISFSGGMQTLINRLYHEVKPYILPVPKNFTFTPNTVICTSAKDASDLLEKEFPHIAQELRQIEYRPLTSLSFFLKSELPQLRKSFGMLFPQKYGGKILGIIHQSEIFPANYNGHCYSVICKGVLGQDEILSELENRITGFDRNDITEMRLSKWEEGLPLYNNKRYEALKHIEALLMEVPGLMLFGNYTKGISLRAMIGETQRPLV